MEREVARVAEACDLRAFRYIPFPGIVFDPVPIIPVVEPDAAMPDSVAIPMAATPMADPKPEQGPEAVLVTAAPPSEPKAIPIPTVQDAPPAFVHPGFRRPAFGNTPEQDAERPQQWAPWPGSTSPVAANRRYRMLQELAFDTAPAEQPSTPSPPRRTPRPAMPALPDGQPRPMVTRPTPTYPAASLPAALPPLATNPPTRGTAPRRAWPR